MSWPWWVWPLRGAPKRDPELPKVCQPRTGKTSSGIALGGRISSLWRERLETLPWLSIT